MTKLNKTMLNPDEMVIGLLLEQLVMAAHYVITARGDHRDQSVKLMEYVFAEVIGREPVRFNDSRDAEWVLAWRDTIMAEVLGARNHVTSRVMTLLVSATILLNVEGGRVTMMPSLTNWFYETNKTNPRLAAHWLIDGWFRDYTAQGMPWRATELAHMYDPDQFERL